MTPIKAKFLAAVSSASLLVACTVAITPEWERYYSHASAGETRMDWVGEIAVDSYGDILVAGETSRISGEHEQNLLLVKFNPQGQRLWVLEYDTTEGLMRSDERVHALVVDSQGNSYVAGTQYLATENASAYGSFLTKVSASGQVIWSRQISEHDNTFTLVLAQDKLYVTGLATQVFDLDGVQVLNIAHPAHPAWAIAVDAAGDMLVAGQSGVARFAADGSLRWRTAVPAGANQQASLAIGVDGSVVLGQGTDDAGAIRVSRLSAFGALEWTRNFAAPKQSYGLPGHVLVGLDARGDIYVVGSHADSRRLVKLDALGRTLWNEARHAGIVHTLNVTDDGNVFMVGAGVSEKRDRNGKLLGEAKLNAATAITDGAGARFGNALYAGYTARYNGVYQIYLAQFRDR